jgi:hypothetical protein
MRPAIAATLLLLPTSAMAGTFVYTPVHVAPVVHVAPMVHVAPTVHVNPGVHPVVRTTPTGGRVVMHSHSKTLPVMVVTTTPNPKKCAKSGKDCQNK